MASVQLNTYRSYTHWVPVSVDDVKVAAGRVQGIDRVRDAAEYEADIKHLRAGYHPDLRVHVILRSLYAPVYGVRHRARDLRERVTGVEHDDELVVWGGGDDGVDVDRLAVGPDHAVRVGVRLPVLVLVRELVVHADGELGHGGDLRVRGQDLGDRQLARDVAARVALAVEQDREEVRGGRVLLEDAREDAVAFRAVERVADDGTGGGTEPDEPCIALRFDVRREAGRVRDQHCKIRYSHIIEHSRVRVIEMSYHMLDPPRCNYRIARVQR